MVQRLRLVSDVPVEQIEQNIPVKRERVRLTNTAIPKEDSIITSKEHVGVKESDMTPEDLTALAQRMFGKNWKTRLAAELDVYVSTVNRWVNGQTPISRRNELAMRGLQAEYESRKVNAA